MQAPGEKVTSAIMSGKIQYRKEQDSMTTSSRSNRRRSNQRSASVRRPVARSIEPPDYSREYADVRRDLFWIAIWGGLLMLGMVIASFVW
jgi:hypothetical protein